MFIFSNQLTGYFATRFSSFLLIMGSMVFYGFSNLKSGLQADYTQTLCDEEARHVAKKEEVLHCAA